MAAQIKDLYNSIWQNPHVVKLETNLSRIKPYNRSGKNSSSSKRRAGILSTLDLTSLGVGSCGGTGMYVVSGMVARDIAGPAVVLSFLLAGLASLLSGFCYAEFGVRVPHTSGSAYTYSYVTVGEFIAFIIGWNMILEYLIGTASGASAISSMIDILTNHRIRDWCVKHMGTLKNFGPVSNTVSGGQMANVENYPDILAFAISLVITVVIMAGVKNSVTFNNILNSVNFFVWIFIVTVGLFFVDVGNWDLPDMGFMPNGWPGVMQGAATCFYAYIGFDIIATTGEECKKPHLSIPRAIISSLVICLVVYMSVSSILTLDQAFYDIDPESPLVNLFTGSLGITLQKVF